MRLPQLKDPAPSVAMTSKACWVHEEHPQGCVTVGGVGAETGLGVGFFDGIDDGLAVGFFDGIDDGLDVGFFDGIDDGLGVGFLDAIDDGLTVGNAMLQR
jgi:hypothetical protein